LLYEGLRGPLKWPRVLPESANRNRDLDGFAVGLIQIFFALVLTLGLTTAQTQGEVLTTWPPGPALLGIGVALVSFVMSWLDWHELMTASPYRLRGNRGGRARVWTDLSIVLAYALALFQLEPMYVSDEADLTPFLVANVVILLLYAAAGGVRIAWGGRSDVLVALGAAAFITALAVAYSLAFESQIERDRLNALALVLLLAIVIVYRKWRSKRAQRGRNLFLALDVDGVLADQVTGILSEARELSGNHLLMYEDVVEWDLRLGPTNIQDLIEGSLEAKRDYVLQMGRHPYVREFVEVAKTCGYQVTIVSARPTLARIPTVEWLKSNDIEFDHLDFVDKTQRSLEESVLVDDFPPNIDKQLNKPSGGRAILVDQPWNRTYHSESGDFFRARNLEAAAGKLVEWWWTSK